MAVMITSVDSVKATQLVLIKVSSLIIKFVQFFFYESSSGLDRTDK